MTEAEYELALRGLGLWGPACETRVGDAYFLVYTMPDGTSKRLPPAQAMSPAERADTVAMLRAHLEIIAANREAKRRPRQ